MYRINSKLLTNTADFAVNKSFCIVTNFKKYVRYYWTIEKTRTQ